MIYIINKFLKYYSINYDFFNITETLSSMQGNTKGSYQNYIIAQSKFQFALMIIYNDNVEV